MAKPPPAKTPGSNKQSTAESDNDPADDNTIKQPKQQHTAKKEPAPSLPLFPDWGVSSFNWGIDPLFGVKLLQSEESGTKISSYATEGGAALKLNDIPLVPSNPGLTTSPYVGYALGQYGIKTNDGQTKTSESSPYHRAWYGDDLSFYLKFFRDVVSVGQGEIIYQKTFKKLQDRSIDNDAGILILPFFSTHYTLRTLDLYRVKISQPLLRQTDNWLHGRVFFDWHKFIFDIGPGYSIDKEFTEINDSNTALHDTYDTSYLLARQGMHVFWKIDMNAQAKYIIKTQLKPAASSLDVIQLPYQGVGDPTDTQTMPEDSLDAYLFVGARDIVAGFGLGWYYNTQVLNNKKRDGQPRTVTTRQGYTVSYSFSL